MKYEKLIRGINNIKSIFGKNKCKNIEFRGEYIIAVNDDIVVEIKSGLNAKIPFLMPFDIACIIAGSDSEEISIKYNEEYIAVYISDNKKYRFAVKEPEENMFYKNIKNSDLLWSSIFVTR